MSAGDAKMRCNGGTSAPSSATAKPGDAITAVWNQWTHSQGPVMVWLYKCACDFKACDGSGKGWFKIDQGGFTPKAGIFLDTETPSGWAIATITKTKEWTTKLPNVVPGNYLLRHELIALHSANAPQYYPECAQLVVTGSGTLTPTADYLVAIPGYVAQNSPSVNVSFDSSRGSCEDCNANSPRSVQHQQPQRPPELHLPRSSRLRRDCYDCEVVHRINE
jgi:hypothetical protein